MNIRTSAFRGLATLSLVALGLAACEGKDEINLPETPPPAVEVTVAPTQVTLAVGQTASAGAVVKNSTNQTVTWSSADATVASVSGTGVITALKPGSTVITATSAADATAKGLISVTVTAPTVTLSVLPTTATINSVAPGNTIQLATTVSGSTNQTVTCVSSATGVATVAAGLVTAVAPGQAVITCTAAADANVKTSAVITVVAPTSNIGITLQPATATTTIAGTVQMVAIVTGSTNTAVTYVSSDTTVAKVNAAGLVSGLKGGTAVITATAAADVTKKATSVITVSGAPPEPSISIASIVYNPSGAPVNPDSIAGQVDVTVNVSAVPQNDVRAVVLFVDSTEVCRQNFATPLGTTQGVATINCPVNTAQLKTNGTPNFPNGLHTFYARAFNGAGGITAQAQFCPVQPNPGQPCVVRFRNVNAVGVQVIPTPPGASDLQGRMWYKAFTVIVTPSIFTLDASQPTPTVDRPLVVLASAYRWNNGSPLLMNQDTIGTPTTPAPLGPLTFTFDATELAGIEDSVYVSVSVSTVGSLTLNNTFGNPNVITPTTPNFSNPSLWVRIDNLAPRVNGFTSFTNPYINNTTTFALAGAQTTDLGVDRQYEAGNIVFDIIDAATGTVVTGCTNVTNASCAPETATNAGYVLRITIKDALGNSRTVYTGANGGIYTTLASAIAGGGTFGVDRTAPVLTVTPSTDDESGLTNILPATLTFAFVDTAAVPAGPSGFAGSPVRVSVRMYNALYPAGTCVAVTVAAGVGTVTSTPSATCNYQLQSSLVLPATLTEAYYVVTSDVADAAGNRTAANTWTTLWDMTAPQVGNLVFPSTVAGGQPFTMSAQIADNVELGQVWSTVIYTGATAFPATSYALVLAEDVIGTYGVPLAPAEVSQNHSVTVANFVRSITVVDAAGRPVVGYANTYTPLAAELAVLDVAGVELGDMCPDVSTTEVSCPTCAASASTQNCFARRQNISAAYQIGNLAAGDSTTAWWGTTGPLGTSFGFTGFSFTGAGDQVTRFVMDATTPAIDALATGPAQTFNNPFPGGVTFWAVDATGRAHKLGAGSISVTDNTITQVRTWRWIYAGAYPEGTTSVFALGMNGTTGDALATQTETVTILPE